ncbi:MAG: methylated-DNA--[protein]-cysteine S-methyltransferase [Candidatus Dormibacteraeota bacterium]|nr:methylated-DNA--[protein]-cysteine S-methyltransferase [Candidatus Dormibacteraeota bacterium]
MITTKNVLHSTTHDTPVGTLTLVASDRGLRAITFPSDSGRIRLTGRPHRNPGHPWLTLATRQLDEYFAGTRMTFDVPLDVEGTRFQLAAWRALSAIPFGTTVSYGHQARQLGIPTAARALGAANRANPVCIIVPCHRVIGANGSLTGFAGGLERKRFLIDHEVATLARTGGVPGQRDGRALQLTAAI